MFSGRFCIKRQITSVLLFILSIILCASPAFAAYTMPVGVPDAWIEPNLASPEAPSPWTSSQAGYYYVDNSVACSDTLNGNGFPGAPRCRFPTTFTAGDYVEIHGGPYNWTSLVRLVSSGTSENPVWIHGDETTKPTFNMGMTVSGTYLYIENLDIVGNHTLDIRPYNNVQTDHVLIRNSRTTGTGTLGTGKTGYNVNGYNGYQAHDVIIHNNEISYGGDATQEDSDPHGLQVGSYVKDIWLLDNTTHHMAGDGFQTGNGGVDSTFIYYGRNTSHDEGENCVDIKNSNDVIVSENICYNLEFITPAGGSGVGMVSHGNSTSPARIWYINNEIYNVNSGIVSSSGTDVYAIGNNIHNVTEHSAEAHSETSTYSSGVGIAMQGGINLHAHYNIIQNVNVGIAYTLGTLHELSLIGNLITNLVVGNVTGNSPYNIILAGDDSALAAAIIDENMFYDPMRFYYDGSTYTDINSLQAVETFCDSCLDSVPVSAPQVMSLATTSSAVDIEQTSPDIIAKFKTLYGIDLSTGIADKNSLYVTFLGIASGEISNVSEVLVPAGFHITTVQ